VVRGAEAKGRSGSASKSGEPARGLLQRTEGIIRRKYPAEDEIRILLEVSGPELSVAKLCRREGIDPRWWTSSTSTTTSATRKGSGM